MNSNSSILVDIVNNYLTIDFIIQYGLVWVLIFFLFTRVVPVTLNIILAIIVSIIFFSIIIIKQSELKNEFFLDLDHKLNVLDPDNSLNFLYLDPDLILFFYQMKDLKNFSPKNFDDMLTNINNLLQIKDNIIQLKDNEDTLNSLVNDIEVANNFMLNTLNHFQSLMLSLPKELTSISEKRIKKLHILLKRNIDEMNKMVDGRELNSSSKFIETYPKGINSSILKDNFSFFI
jgi:hypothetical protein